MLEAYNALMKHQLQHHESVVAAVKQAKQHPALVEKKAQLLERKKARYEQRRKVLQDSIDSGNMEKAKKQFQNDTDKEYVALQPVFRRHDSPRRTIKQKHQKKVLEMGGPVHPNILPNNVVNAKTKKVKNEFRHLTRLPMQGFGQMH